MADHDVRREAKPLQRPRGLRHDLRATDPRIKLPRRDMGLLRSRTRLHVGNLSHPLDHVRVGFGNEDDLVRLHRHEMPREMKELPRKVLVDKEEFQRVIPNGGRRRAGHWLRSFFVRIAQAIGVRGAAIPGPKGQATPGYTSSTSTVPWYHRRHGITEGRDITGTRANDGSTARGI